MRKMIVVAFLFTSCASVAYVQPIAQCAHCDNADCYERCAERCIFVKGEIVCPYDEK